MKTAIKWKEGMEFEALAEGHQVSMDAKAPIGKDRAPTPKELVAMGLGGCTAMDVIAILKKNKQLPTSFNIEVEIQPSSNGHPIVFDKAFLSFLVEGQVQESTLTEAVHLSQTKYCGVSAMLSKAFPIEYRIILNGTEIGKGQAKFENFAKETA